LQRFDCLDRKRFWKAAVSTNPNGGDTNVILSQLETSGPTASNWIARTAFPNLRSFCPLRLLCRWEITETIKKLRSGRLDLHFACRFVLHDSEMRVACHKTDWGVQRAST